MQVHKPVKVNKDTMSKIEHFKTQMTRENRTVISLCDHLLYMVDRSKSFSP